jgi:hypothetical protein
MTCACCWAEIRLRAAGRSRVGSRRACSRGRFTSELAGWPASARATYALTSRHCTVATPRKIPAPKGPFKPSPPIVTEGRGRRQVLQKSQKVLLVGHHEKRPVASGEPSTMRPPTSQGVGALGPQVDTHGHHRCLIALAGLNTSDGRKAVTGCTGSTALSQPSEDDGAELSAGFTLNRRGSRTRDSPHDGEFCAQTMLDFED